MVLRVCIWVYRIQCFLRFRVQGFRFRIWVLGQGLRFKAQGFFIFKVIGYGVYLGFQGLGLQVYWVKVFQGLGFFCVYQGLAYTIWGFIGFRTQKFQVQGLGLRIFLCFLDLGFTDFQDLQFRVQGFFGAVNGFQGLYYG